MVDKILGIIYKLNTYQAQEKPKQRVLLANKGTLPIISPALIISQAAPEESILTPDLATNIHKASSRGVRNSSDKAIINWLINRNKGAGNLKSLAKALLKGKPSTLWKAQIAIILFSEIDTNPEIATLLISFLIKYCNKIDKDSLKTMDATTLSAENKQLILNTIWKMFLEKNIGNPNNNHYDPIVAGDYYLTKYTVTKSSHDLDAAQEHYKYVTDRPTFKVHHNNKLFLGIAIRYRPYYIMTTEYELYDEVKVTNILYTNRKISAERWLKLKKEKLKRLPRPLYEQIPEIMGALNPVEIEYYRYQTRALAKLAQIELMRIKNPEDRQQRLAKAADYANQALKIIKNKKTSIKGSSIKFNDFTPLELAKTLAEINLQQAELAKENKDTASFQTHLTKATAQVKALEDLFRNYEKLCKGKKIESPWYKQIKSSTKILKAKTLLYSGKANEIDISDMDSLPIIVKLGLAEKMVLAYYEKRDEQSYIKATKQLEQIINNSQSDAYSIAKAKLLLGEIRGVKAGNNLSLLQEAKNLLHQAINSKQLKDEELAKAKKTLGENLTRQAFLNSEETESLLSLAETEFKAALELKISKYDKDSANIWLAKIHLFKANLAKDNASQRTALVESERFASSALQSDSLDDKTLSEVYQLQGDIKVAWKNYDSAIDLYLKAIEKNPDNQNAKVSLANVYAWQGYYTKALKTYREVTTQAHQNNKTAVYKARLGIADIYNWKEDYQIAISKYENIATDLNAETKQDAEIDRLKLQAKLAYYEAQLRSGNYDELENAEQKASEILDNEPYGSPILMRTKFFMLEIADAYIATNQDEKALPILNGIKDDPETNPQTGKHDEITLGMLTHLRLARYYNSNDNKNKANEHFNEIYGLYIGGVTALRNDNSELTNQELLMKAEALVFFKRYKEAAAIYEQVLQNPEISVRQRLDILCDYSSLFTFDDAKKKDRVEDHDRAEEYFDTIILHYGNNSDLSNKEKLLYVKALFNMAEIKRWGDNRDYDLSLAYYLDALEILEKTGTSTKTVKELKARVNIGLARIYEVKGDMASANKHARAATKEKEEIAKVYQKAAKRAKASVSRPLLRAKHSQFRSKRGEVELREEIELRAPVHPNIDVTVTERIDHDEHPETTTSTYVGAAAHNVPIAKDTYLDVEARGKVVTTQSGKGRTEYYRQSDLETSTRVRNPYVQAELNTGHDIRRKELGTTVNTNVLFRAAGVTNIPFLRGLEVGVEYNKYDFLLNGTHLRRNVSLLTRGSWSLVDDFLSVGFQANYPYVEFLPYADYTNDDSDSGTKATYHPVRGRVGGNLRFSFRRWGVPIDLTAEFNYYRQFSHVGPNNKEQDYQFNETMFNINLLNFLNWPYNQ